MDLKNLGFSTAFAFILLGTATSVIAQPSSAVYGTTSSGKRIFVRFDNLAVPPSLNDDFTLDLTSDPNNPKVGLLTGRNVSGTLQQWRVWCQDTQNNNVPANIGEIKGITGYDFDVKIFDASGGPGAATVGEIKLEPSGSHYSNITGGNIETLTGNLTLKQDPTWSFQNPNCPYTTTGQVGNLHIGSVTEGSVLVIPGGVRGGYLEIDRLEPTSITQIGPVYEPNQLIIDEVGEYASLHLLNQWEGNWTEPNVIPEVHLGLLDDYACVTVSCQYVLCTPVGCQLPPPPPVEILTGCCNDNEQETIMTIAQMETGAKLHHRGVGPLDSLTIGVMKPDVEVIIGTNGDRRLSGVLNLPQGIGSGALVTINSPQAATSIFSTGVVDLHGGILAGTLQVDSNVAGLSSMLASCPARLAWAAMSTPAARSLASARC